MMKLTKTEERHIQKDFSKLYSKLSQNWEHFLSKRARLETHIIHGTMVAH